MISAYLKLSKIIALASICVGLIVVIGWVLDISVLKSIIPNGVTMKFSTAVSFVFSGITIYFITKHDEGKTGIAQIAIPISGFVISLFMATILAGYVFGVNSGIEQLFVKESPNSVQTPVSGRPSVSTMVSFILIVIVGIFALSETRLRRLVGYVGYVISVIGMVAVAGYITNQPILYYYTSISTGMAIHSSILFVLLGASLVLLRNKITTQHHKSVKIQTRIAALFFAASLIPLIFVIGLNFNIGDTANNELVKNSTGIISVITAIIVTVFSVLTAKSISKPIIHLKAVSDQISKGNLSIRADEVGNDEVGDLSKTFNHMVDSVIKTERLSTIGLLSSTLGHDLKNNLTLMMTTLNLLDLKYKDKLDVGFSEKLTVLNRSVLNMRDQIDSMLDFIRQTPLKLEDISFLELMKSVLKIIKVPETIQITVPTDDILISCDSRKLETVMVNLINNSIQAMDSSGKITIRTNKDNRHCTIEIEDSGSGISLEIISKIFDPLFTTKRTGTGLGLASCKNIIEQHGGTITVRNQPTTFTIKIPNSKDSPNS